MEGTIGEIRAFAGNFAPQTWMFCHGQSLSISMYTPLYAILGTNYGGDGVNTFKLPNIASRIVVGAGQGQGLSHYSLGEVDGEEQHTLIQLEMPTHTHLTTQTNSTAAAAVDISLNGVAVDGTLPSPQGNYLAQDSSGNDSIYADPNNSPNLVSLDSQAVQISNLTPPRPVVTIGLAGASVPHNNIQPVLGVNYVICVEGLFPSRD
ncbi:phage tail protein [uncultured Pedobacter sp.]|uniref:phage tail protein n=1 Tax=uncultured Pedobacter sp. TaxID=246139 RepID=UPI0025F6BFF3|nr:tail fiber protein [uncultured Pedobacter sp.]